MITVTKGYIMIKRRHLRKLIKYISETGEVIGEGSINFASRGYLRMHLKGKPYYLHQLVWVYVYGSLPNEGTVGFVDGDKLNLKIDNLYNRKQGRGCKSSSSIIFREGSYIKL